MIISFYYKIIEKMNSFFSSSATSATSATRLTAAFDEFYFFICEKMKSEHLRVPI